VKLIHTADWHLGRSLHHVSLLEDQAWVLERFLALVRDEQPDAVLVAGDVYDRAVPPAEAVALLDHILEELTLDQEVPVVLIVGDHDDPERLGFARRLLSGRRLHVSGRVGKPAPVRLRDAHGTVQVWPLPFATPDAVRAALGVEVRTRDEALGALLDRVRAGIRGRAVVVAHADVAGGTGSGERPWTGGEAERIAPGRFAGFAYAALGHLHRAQDVTGTRARFSGSPFPLSFEEAADPKTVSVVDIAEDGGVTVRPVALGRKRNLRHVSGTLAELLAAREPMGSSPAGRSTSGEPPAAAQTLDPEARGRAAGQSADPEARGRAAGQSADPEARGLASGQPADPEGGGREAAGADDWLDVTLLDSHPARDAVARLRELFPNVIRVRRAGEAVAEGVAPRVGGPSDAAGRGGVSADPETATDEALFAAFFERAVGAPLTPEESAEAAEAMRAAAAREVS